MANDTLLQDLGRLRDALRAVALPLPLAHAEEALATGDEAIAQIEDYLIPRLAHLDAPLLAVLGGSTGSGKSTLTNSLVGHEVSVAGVLRPTTRSPVLVHHPDDTAWFAGDTVLPDLPRQSGQRGTGNALHLVATPAMPVGLGLLDSPDIDSIEVANHELATQLLGAADLWLFVTTAARYADAVPWQYLARASERAAAVALIVNRIPPSPDSSALTAITQDVRRLLDANGLQYAELFAIEETPLSHGLMAGAENQIRNWIGGLVADADARAEVIRHTVEGAVSSLTPRAQRVLSALHEQREAAAALQQVTGVHQRESVQRVAAELGSGVLLRGEVLERFREQVGTAQWMDSLQRGVGRLRDRLTSLVTGQTPPVEAAKGRLRSNLVGLVDDAVSTGVEQTVAAWRALPGGDALLAGEGLQAGGVTLQPVEQVSDASEIEAAIAAWQDDVVAMVRERAGSKLAVARGLTLGVNGIGVTLMMALFASTGGLTGGEVAVAGGTAAFSQALLSAVFGEQAVRDLAAAARTSLLTTVEQVARARHQGFHDRLNTLPSGQQIADLTTAIRQVSQ
ncbi:MAG: ABC transporter [Euzebya sp.]